MLNSKYVSRNDIKLELFDFTGICWSRISCEDLTAHLTRSLKVQ